MSKVRVLGGGWYGCHLTLSLKKAGHDVVLHERSGALFSGASGNQPARLHLGFHYPRSKLTRAACQDHYRRFMTDYGHLTSGVPSNIYAIAAHLSLVDFGTYRQLLKEEVEFVQIERPEEFGLQHIEGALLTGERHVVIRKARDYFTAELSDIAEFGVGPEDYQDDEFALTIDCTFCARDSRNIDRYEPCVTAILEGPTHQAVTIMDGPFPSLYPWDEDRNLCSLTSASLTPLSKSCKSYGEAQAILRDVSNGELHRRAEDMVWQMAHYFPQILDYKIIDKRVAIRAMPLSGADARLVDVVQTGERCFRIRASKLDAIFYAEDVIREHIPPLCLH